MIRPRQGGARSGISLGSRARALPFLICVGCAGLWLAGEASLVALVSIFRAPTTGRWLLRADGRDARLRHQLGQAYLDTDPTQSLRNLRLATQLSPLNRLYWEDLESACESYGDLPCADQASARLVELCPMVPSYHWIAAQSCLRTNRRDLALELVQRMLALDPTYAQAAWSALQKLRDPQLVYERVLGDSRDARIKVSYVDALSAEGDNDTAYEVWRQVCANSGPFPFAYAEPYLDREIDLGRIEEAVNVWRDLERLGIIKGNTANKKGNLVYNGDFEYAPLDAGFDWRIGPTAYLAVDFSAPGAYHGARCLRVDFTFKRNDEYEPVYQIVPVLPLHAYNLEGFIRSENITSDSGPCLRVTDTRVAGFPEAVSETTVGTTAWHRVRVAFSTGPQTHAVRISFWRSRSVVFPEQVTGTSWLDAVSLECLGPGKLGAEARREDAQSEEVEGP